jgi:hypothetical protein
MSETTNGAVGGPGRGRRRVEREYLAALGEAVSLDDWRAVVQAAVTAAKEGDCKARDWLTRHLLGEKPRRLSELAADEADGFGVDEELAEIQGQRRQDRYRHSLLNGLIPRPRDE